MTEFTTEIPSSLKQLARLTVRGFYGIEDALVIDMLVRNPCLREEDISELLKFEKKMLRARLTQLKNDKFIQARLKMETGAEGKATKINYYFINYKTFVNVIKYKFDLMRKRLETEERDATSRASFKCSSCDKKFTDLEVDKLMDFETGEFTCWHCGGPVVDDMSAMPKKDSRLMLAKFNDQLQPIYDLLQEVEGIKLSPELLDPQPVDINVIRGIQRPHDQMGNEVWSGEATRGGGFAVEETRVDITIGDVDQSDAAPKKEQPTWMTTSTVEGVNDDDDYSNQEAAMLEKAAQSSAPSTSWSSKGPGGRKKDSDDNIMSVLLQHEKQITKDNTDAVKNLNARDDSSGGGSSGDDDDEFDKTEIPNIEMMNDDDSDEDVPTVLVNGVSYPVSEVMDNTDLIAKMTPHEKAQYIQVCQDYYSHLYE